MRCSNIYAKKVKNRATIRSKMFSSKLRSALIKSVECAHKSRLCTHKMLALRGDNLGRLDGHNRKF